jgi:CheY-like chemotaxis protein
MEQRLRILLAEDDPVSRAFLSEVLSSVGDVTGVADGETALALATDAAFDILLLDQNLPRRSGSAVVAALRANAAAGSARARMIGLSAGLDAALAKRLRDTGFDEALGKPIEAAALLASVHGPPATDAPAHAAAHLLDDHAALRALGGSQQTLNQLRRLLAAELPAQLEAVTGHFERGEATPLCAILHRLQAGCGFCGATALADATLRLAATVRSGDFDRNTLTAFLETGWRLLSSLDVAAGKGQDS